MQTCDALIVGGGPAGSACATRLKEAGLDVLVLDKAAFPRDKPCAGWITPQVVEALRLSPKQYADGRTFQPITGFVTGLLGGEPIETRYDRPVSYGIRRCEFDRFLLERSGARVRAGTPVTSLRRHHGDWVVNEDVRTPLVVGAGGHFCPVARFLGGPPERDVTVVAQEVEYRMDARTQDACAVRPEVPELYFSADRRGYGWCFRKGAFLNVGLGRQGEAHLSRHVADFVSWLQGRGRLPHDLPSRFRGHAYLLNGTSPRPLLGEGALLIGDAAGLAYTESGEGIRPAVESGFLAAAVVLGTGDRYRREDLEPYETRIRERFGTRKLHRPALSWFPEPLRSRLTTGFLSNPWLARHVLLDRWFLRTGVATFSPDTVATA